MANERIEKFQFFKWLKNNHRFIWCVLVSIILTLAVIPAFIMCITSPFVSRIKEFFCDIARDTIDNLSEMKLIWKAFADVKAVWKGKEVRDGE